MLELLYHILWTISLSTNGGQSSDREDLDAVPDVLTVAVEENYGDFDVMIHFGNISEDRIGIHSFSNDLPESQGLTSYIGKSPGISKAALLTPLCENSRKHSQLLGD